MMEEARGYGSVPTQPAQCGAPPSVRSASVEEEPAPTSTNQFSHFS